MPSETLSFNKPANPEHHQRPFVRSKNETTSVVDTPANTRASSEPAEPELRKQSFTSAEDKTTRVAPHLAAKNLVGYGFNVFCVNNQF